jgi:tRNA G18 (ribose-2'-O)-methylase SpoU
LPLVLVCDNLRSLYNIGSLFRSADAILLEKIYLCGICGTPPRSQIEKVALGATEVVPWEYFEKVEECLAELKMKGYEIVALELTDQSVSFEKMAWKAPTALIVGNEVEGISESAMTLVDRAVDLPMLGRANSLNVATAFAVVGYDFFNKYHAQN